MKERIKKLIPRPILDVYYFMMEWFSALAFGFPGKKLKVIGITGTKGKSTTTFLITRILEEAGLRVASLSSIEFRINKRSEANSLKMTLPSRFTLQRFLRRALLKRVDYMVLEVTSEGLAQHRVDFIRFIAAVFTNLAPEHIESHGSYENYKKAKRRLFELLDEKGLAVINGEDREAKYMASAVRGKMIFYSPKKAKPFDMPLAGAFNQANALAASTLCAKLGISSDVIIKILKKIALIPGRLEEIREGQNFRVFVDYAHNPSSLEAVLKTVLRIKKHESRVIVLTGAQGGGRDKWKRPEMGKIAATYADVVIITNEDPYKENPKQIIEDVYQGTLKTENSELKTIKEILDRKEAIKTALRMAKKDDIVVCAGKGSETVMETAKGKIPWNEREIVRKELKRLITNN